MGDFQLKRFGGKALFLSAVLSALLFAYFAFSAPSQPSAVWFEANKTLHYDNDGVFTVNWTDTQVNISNYTVYIINNTGTLWVNVTFNSSSKGYYFAGGIHGGNYTFNISAINLSDGTSSLNATSDWIFVDSQNPVTIINSPVNGLNTSNATVSFNFNSYDNTALNCSLIIDGAVSQQNSSVANNTATIFSATSEGRHLWNISCSDSALNLNTTAAYSIGIDRTAPSVALNSPGDTQWDIVGNLNFTFTATDSTSSLNNCSLWLNTTSSTLSFFNTTNATNSLSNNTQFTFFNNGTSLSSGTHFWNVQCYDNATNFGRAAQNYTFIVGSAPDFIVTDVRLVNSSALQWSNPVPGSNLFVNATIMNNGTANPSLAVPVALFWEDSLTPLIQANISSASLTVGGSINITFNITGGNVTGFTSHNVKIGADFGNVILETNETNNNRTISVFSGLNITTNMTNGSAAATPKAGESILLNITVLYQNGSAVPNLTISNFTIYDIYAYGSATATNRTPTITAFSGTLNASGIYTMNITAPAKSAGNKTEYGNHTVSVFVSANTSGNGTVPAIYYGWDNRTSNYYTLLSPNLEAAFSGLASSIDLASYSGTDSFEVQIKNNGTVNLSRINISVQSNKTNSLLYNASSNYSTSVSCNYTATLVASASAGFSTVSGCSLTFNSTATGTYNLTIFAGGIDPDGSQYNSSPVQWAILITNSTSTNATSTSSSSGSSSGSSSSSSSTTYSLNITAYNSTASIEQGKSALLSFTVKNTGNGTVTNISFSMALPEGMNWGSWYTVPEKISRLASGESASITTNVSVPLNATIAANSVTAKFAGLESGASKTATFALQVFPGATARESINVSLKGFEAEIAKLNESLLSLMEKSGSQNLTLAKNKLNRAAELLAEAQNETMNGDYFAAYNTKAELEALLSDVRQILGAETETIQAGSKRTAEILIALGIIIALAAIAYYSWMPQEGYNPKTASYASGDKKPLFERIREKLKGAKESLKINPQELIEKVSEKKVQSGLLKNPEPAFTYTPPDAGIAGKLKKMRSNLKEQLTEYGAEDKEPVYNFQKKKKWDAPS